MQGRAVWWSFGLLVAVASLQSVKLCLNFSLGPAPVCMDAIEYLAMGRSVANGDLLLLEHYVSYRVPGYSWLVGACLALFKNDALVAIVLLQHLLAALTCALTGRLCYRLTGSYLAAAAGVGLSALLVSRDWFATTLLTETLFTFMLTLLWSVWYEYLRRPVFGMAVLLGLVLGLSTLVRPITELLWIPISATIVFVGMASLNWKWKRVAAHCLVIVGVTAVVVSPWCYRNWTMFGAPFVAKLPAVNKWQACFQDGASANLPLPKCPAGDRLLAMLHSCDHDMNDLYCYSVIHSLERCGLSEREIDQLVNSVCLAAIKENPVQFGFAALKRCGNFWRCVRNEYPHWGYQEASRHGDLHTWRDQRLSSIYEPLLVGALSRSLTWNEFVLACLALSSWWVVCNSRTRAFAIGIVLTFAYFTVITAVAEIENYRYRMVLEPAIIATIVAGVDSRFFRHRRAENSAGQTGSHAPLGSGHETVGEALPLPESRTRKPRRYRAASQAYDLARRCGLLREATESRSSASR